MSTAVFDLPQSRRSPAELAQALRSSHASTLRLTRELAQGQWLGPYLPIVNPPLWELGHIAWFLERWVLRRDGSPSSMAGADALYDSSRIAHVARWFLPLPDVPATYAYLWHVTEQALQQLESGAPFGGDELYYLELALHHQDMHNEAFRYSWQTLGYPDPLAASPPTGHGDDLAGPAADIAVPRGSVSLGARRDEGFVFDNEKWAHALDVAAFSIASQPVSNSEFLGFVEAGGYLRREFWCEAGWAWRQATALRHPRYWQRSPGWQLRRFERWEPLPGNFPVMHVNAYEAEAYCRWAGRRLPSEAQWLRAAATAPQGGPPRSYPWGEAAPTPARANLNGAGVLAVDALPAGDSGWGLRQMLGNVWEWTSSAFQPFPGFSVDPYQDYSRPWFGSHRVLRGGSFATQPRLARNGYRNFYTPDRGDVFCGFRTCAPT